MRTTTKLLLTGIAVIQLGTLGTFAQYVYQIDTAGAAGAVNASDGTETIDNWFGNQFTAIAGATVLNGVDWGVFTANTRLNTTATLAIYRGGIGSSPVRIWTQQFTPYQGTAGNWYMQHINLTTPVNLNVGDTFIVSVYIPQVVGDTYFPYEVDTYTNNSTGSYWNRGNVGGTLNLDDLSQAVLLTSDLPPDGSGAAAWHPGPGHLVLRADAVPEPAVVALSALAAVGIILRRRR